MNMNEQKIIDIISKGEYPADVLSNFYPREFSVDGVRCASMEGFLQSLKTRNISTQKKICALTGKEAKNYFRHKWSNLRWKLTGNLYWQGRKLKRIGKEYEALITHAYDEMGKDEIFKKALRATENATLTHSIGKQSKRKTVLTEKELITQLTRLRDTLE